MVTSLPVCDLGKAQLALVWDFTTMSALKNLEISYSNLGLLEDREPGISEPLSFLKMTDGANYKALLYGRSFDHQ
jgi:hypothetical protein